jgi:hypothetical protein
MTICAVRVLRVQVVLWTCGFIGTDAMGRAVTGQAELRHATRNQQSRVRRTVRRVTGDASVGLHGSMFVNKRSLLVCVTLDASSVGARRQSCLLEFETAVRVVAIAALHRAFQHLVMERQVELMLGLTMTTETKLRLAVFEQFQVGEAWLL